MGITRFLLLAVLGGWIGNSVAAQTVAPPSPVSVPADPPPVVHTPVPAGGIASTIPVPSAAPITATNVLTAPPGSSIHPPGTVTSPFAPNGCNGPYGGNGPVTYELYVNTGPALVIGGSELSARINTGWRTTVGARTLLFNTTGDAAWVLDLGIGYTYNRGRQERGGPIDVHTPAPPLNVGGQQIPQPDGLRNHIVRGLHRTEFNFALGRDWWLRDVGFVTPHERDSWNRRIGFDLGGTLGDITRRSRARADRPA